MAPPGLECTETRAPAYPEGLGSPGMAGALGVSVCMIRRVLHPPLGSQWSQWSHLFGDERKDRETQAPGMGGGCCRLQRLCTEWRRPASPLTASAPLSLPPVHPVSIHQSR